MTIRLRLIVYYSGLLIIILSLFGIAVFGMLQWTMRGQVDTTLKRVLNEVLEETGGTVKTAPDGTPQLTAYVPRLDTFRTPGIYVQIWEVYNGETLFSKSENLGTFNDPLDPKAIGEEKEVHSIVTINGTNLRVITKPIVIEGRVVGNVQAAASLTLIEAASDRLLKIMLGGGLIALILSLLIGDWLARRTLRPIGSIVSTAQSIAAADDLSRRIPNTGPQDELGRMVSVFNETLSRLENLFKAQRRFVADVSHELRSPLTTIQGNLDLVRLYGNDPRSIEAMESEVKRMSRLVGDLLLLAQADAGQIPLEMEALDIDQLVLEIYGEAGFLSQGKHRFKLGQLDQVRVNADVDRLKQLLLNLVSNAIKYTPDDGSVSMSVTRQGTNVYVTVEDTGVGIPAEDLAHIFDRFYRVDKARSRAAGGTGLGLSIAQWIAEAHGGEILVASEFGKGTTFTVVLPILSGESESDEQSFDPRAARFVPMRMMK
jgi:two-component system, OmpR family, sensor kinase